MRFKGVLLDIDNTLYAYDEPHRHGLEAALADIRPHTPLSDELLRERFAAARKRINTRLMGTAASHNRLLYFQLLCESLGLNSMQHAPRLYERYWETFLEQMRPDDGVYDLLSAASPHGICLVTDLTAHIQFRKIERLGLATFATHLVTSEEAGREKPDPAMFQLAMEKLGTVASVTCMIGDHYEKDILGARALGIQAFWLNRTGEQRPMVEGVQEVRSMRELMEHLND